MDYTIEDYSPRYAEAVNRLAVAAFAEFEDIYDDWPTFAQKIGAMASLVDRADIIVATVDHTPVGAVAYVAPGRPKGEWFPQEWAVIRMLVVDPAARGQGIGKALTQECVERATLDKAPCIGLHTSPIMRVALPMYLRLGFGKKREAPDIHGVPYAIYAKRCSVNG